MALANEAVTEPVLGVPDAAKALGVDKSTIYAMIHAGELAYSRVRRRYFVEVAEIERYKREHTFRRRV
jgi:excisionase family DNA binding protein